MKIDTYFKRFSTLLLGMSLVGCATTPSQQIPILTVGQMAQQQRYFDALEYYHDRGLMPLNSIQGIANDMASDASAKGATGFIITKSYEKYDRGVINGQYAFVEGFGVKWKSNDETTLINDLKQMVAQRGGKPVIQIQALLINVKKQNIQAAVPLLREFMQTAKIAPDALESVRKTYLSMAGPSEVPYAVELIKTKKGPVRSTAIAVLCKNPTPKYASLQFNLLQQGEGGVPTAKALRKLKLKDHTGDWENLLKYHEDIPIRVEAAKALVALGERRPVELAAKQTSNSAYRRQLYQILLQ